MQTLDLLDNKMNKAFAQIFASAKELFVKNTSKLNSLSPTNVLLRGYSMVCKNDEIITSKEQLKTGDLIQVKMSDGEIQAEVK